MRLECPGASPEQLAAGVAAARAFLESKGVTLEQVVAAWWVYEVWIESESSTDPPEHGHEVREIWNEAAEIAIGTACPEVAGAKFRLGVYQLYWNNSVPDPAWLSERTPDPLPF